MALYYGFKAHANRLAEEGRNEVGLRLLDPFEPHLLAKFLAINVQPLSQVQPDSIFLSQETHAFSAVTVFYGYSRLITYNDSHSPARQKSDLAHELAHALLQHPAVPALDHRGCRDWDQDLEDEAEYLSGVLLLSDSACLAIARGSWDELGASGFFGISQKMVNYRMNQTGARKRVQRTRGLYRRSVK